MESLKKWTVQRTRNYNVSLSKANYYQKQRKQKYLKIYLLMHLRNHNRYVYEVVYNIEQKLTCFTEC